MDCDIAVVGAGALGVTTAYWLSELYDCSILVLDRESDVALNGTLRNTGIAHRPYYLNPEKKRVFAQSAEKSFHLWKALASSNDLPWKETGTMTVATDESQVSTLEEYSKWGVKNGMEAEECEVVDERKAKEVEPSVTCKGAIISNRDAATDFALLTRAVWQLASRNGARMLPEAELEGVQEADGRVSVTLRNHRTVSCSLLINAAGGGSLKIAHRIGLAKEYAELHFRGEYWKLDRAMASPITRSVYSVARHGEFPFLDPHFIIRADGRREVGPNAVLVSGPYAYEGVGGVHKFLAKVVERPLKPKARLFMNGEFLSLVWDEWRSSLSKRAMCKRVQRFVPGLDASMLAERGAAGVRSSLIGPSGFVPEALVMKTPSSLHVLNFNSPGATGGPAYSANLVRTLEEEGQLDGFRRKPKTQVIWDYDDTAVDR